MIHRLKLTILFVLSTLVASAIVALSPTYAWSLPATRTQENVPMTVGVPTTLKIPATHVVVRWKGDAAAIVEVRGSSAAEAKPSNDNASNTVGSEWSEWKGATYDDGNTADETVHSSNIVLFDNARRVQVAVERGDAHDITLTAIDTKNGPRTLELQHSTKPAGALNAQTPQPNIVSRAQWGANESLMGWDPSFINIKRIVVHHTVTPNNDPDPAATVRAIYAYHAVSNGWGDIGYNFLIDASGRIYEGRYSRQYPAGVMPSGDDATGRGVVGGHALGANYDSVGVALLGTFTSVSPGSAQITALSKLVAWEGDRHNLDLTSSWVVSGHRDVYQTSCPGDGGYTMLPRVRTLANGLKYSYNIPGNTPGYWITGANGGVQTYGSARNYGSMAGHNLNAGIVGMTRMPNSDGYWLLGSDGGIFSFGTAQFYGSMGGQRLNAPIVGLASTTTGRGYWLVGADGGIFAFGDAKFYGSMGGQHLNAPVVNIAPTSTGNGYWMVAADGGIFAFGDAKFYGSMGGQRLAQPMAGMTTAPNGRGYWLFARDGGVFSYGAVDFYGSIPILALSNRPATSQAVATQTGNGYYVLTTEGSVYSFGDARFWGTWTGGGAATGFALVGA